MSWKFAKTSGASCFWIVLFVYIIWYAAGFLVLATGIFPTIWRTKVSGWGDCVFLSLAGILTFLIVRRDFSWKSTILAGLWIILGAGAAELAGVTTGYPFGSYQYTNQLGTKLLGHLPWIIPISWLALVVNAYVISSILVRARLETKIATDDNLVSKRALRRNSGQGYTAHIFLTALIVTIGDFNLEPVALNIREYWYWLERDRSYYGVPLINFSGWFIISSILAAGLSWILDSRRLRISTAWISFALLSSIQLLFAVMNWRAGQYIPAWITLNLIGGLAMGLIYFSEER